MTVTATSTLQALFDQHGITPPATNDEDWLYYNVPEVLSRPLPETQSVAPSTQLTGNYLYFLNGTLVDHKLPPGGVISTTSCDMAATQNGFIHLANTAQEVTLVFNDAQAEVTIMYEATSHQKTRLNIVLNGSTMQFNRVFINQDASATQMNVCHVELHKKSVCRVTEKNMNNEGVILDFMDTHLHEHTELTSLNESYLSAHGRFQNRVFIHGEQAHARLHGAAIHLPHGRTHYNTHVYHAAANTESHQLFKSLNKDAAIFEYNGKVTVKPGAQQINSYQLNQNILLDDYANVYSRPQLFIDADDVKCSHGSTTGDLNQDQLFYLKSRGLGDNDSKKIILRAFIDDVLSIQGNTPDAASLIGILNQII
jgi:Fe-S cluster assembly scaffold protein SufB